MAKKAKKKRSTLDDILIAKINKLVKEGKNQRQVAKTLGIAQSSVSRWVNGNKPPKNPRGPAKKKAVKKVTKAPTKKKVAAKATKKAPKKGATRVRSPSRIGARDASSSNGSVAPTFGDAVPAI